MMDKWASGRCSRCNSSSSNCICSETKNVSCWTSGRCSKCNSSCPNCICVVARKAAVVVVAEPEEECGYEEVTYTYSVTKKVKK